MFLIRYNDGVSNVVLIVTPKPTSVEYPEKRELNVERTQDGAVVIQRPARDGRPREWIWTGYPIRLTGYAALWETLETLDVKSRLIDDLDPIVEMWENQTGHGGLDKLTDTNPPDLVTYSNLDWTQVKITMVTREHRKGGGPSTYETSKIVFHIVDPDWDNF